jgi:hypothetical protein
MLLQEQMRFLQRLGIAAGLVPTVVFRRVNASRWREGVAR